MPTRHILTERQRLLALPTDEPSLLEHYTLAEETWNTSAMAAGHLDLSQHRYDLLRFVPLHWHLIRPPP